MDAFTKPFVCVIWIIVTVCFENNSKGQELTNSTESLTATEGGSITLPCTAHNISDKKVFWFQNEGYPIFVLNESQIADDRFELGRSNDDDWGLQIQDVTEWDAGTYRCLLNTKPVQMKTLHLTVLTKINKTVSSTNMNVFEGEDVELYCEVRGNPEPLVRWIRNGESVVVGKNLSLHDVTCESSGTYTCTASNNVGKAAYHDIQVAVCTNAAEETHHRNEGFAFILFFWCIKVIFISSA
uniref:Lachesin-like isoform X2 n=1 Tax=Crassostrea virginica TaxID=6565 RepID=A0A8B8B3Z4_CRAVI|nr:lachesin-like isoform X2 [Crassostrea virginica]